MLFSESGVIVITEGKARLLLLFIIVLIVGVFIYGRTFLFVAIFSMVFGTLIIFSLVILIFKRNIKGGLPLRLGLIVFFAMIGGYFLISHYSYILDIPAYFKQEYQEILGHPSYIEDVSQKSEYQKIVVDGVELRNHSDFVDTDKTDIVYRIKYLPHSKFIVDIVSE
jgi:energy-coupling factor transporter transmembrane protein EcfT